MGYLIGLLSSVLNIAEVALGLGFVIFLHELGHFALAKWNGVKVEKFSIGFGKTIIGFTRGETEYVLAIIPLGGFVKMLGEGPDEEASKSTDPRAYPNKSVGARMAIISAGVIMNLILGLACFAYAYGKGRDEISSRIGAVIAGSPAYDAGIQAGDEIVSIDGRPNRSFENVMLKIRLSSAGQVLHLQLKRPGQDGLVAVNIEPKRGENSDHPTVGIAPSRSLDFAKPPFAAPAGIVEDPKTDGPGLKAGDSIVAVGPVGSEPTPVENVLMLQDFFSKHLDKPLNLVVNRKKLDEQGKPLDANAAPEKVTIVLQPNRFVDFGMRFQIKGLAAVRKGSIADKAGFKKGDLILKINGDAEFDPIRLPSLVQENAGKPMTFEVRREDSDPKTPPIVLTATPDATPAWVEDAIPGEPLDVPGLGLAYQIRTKVESVRPGSPAEKAGIKTGNLISSLTFPATPGEAKAANSDGLISGLLKSVRRMFRGDEEAPKGLKLEFNDEAPNWPFAFQVLQYTKLNEVELTRDGASDIIKLKAEPVEGWYSPRRGEQLTTLISRGQPLDLASAVGRGFDDTVDNVASIYAMLRSLVQGRVSHKGLGGPILIANVAYERAASSFTDLVHFLGFLSINLAVLNFLPIPPLDGGQMIFLIAEKIRGRPLPDSALIAGTYLGLVLVLCLMVFVLFQDVARFIPSF